MARSLPDLKLLEGVVAPGVLDAMKVASEALSRLGVRHVLAGGLAVGAYGYPRATKDVDFLVGDEAFEHHPGGIITMKSGVPIEVRGVVVDFLSVGESEGYLAEAFTTSLAAGIPVAPGPVLVYLKLKSPRAKDRADLIEMVKAGFDTRITREYLVLHAPALASKWDAIVGEARSEE